MRRPRSGGKPETVRAPPPPQSAARLACAWSAESGCKCVVIDMVSIASGWCESWEGTDVSERREAGRADGGRADSPCVIHARAHSFLPSLPPPLPPDPPCESSHLPVQMHGEPTCRQFTSDRSYRRGETRLWQAEASSHRGGGTTGKTVIRAIRLFALLSASCCTRNPR